VAAPYTNENPGINHLRSRGGTENSRAKVGSSDGNIELLKKTRKTIAAIATSSVRSLMGRLVAEVDERIGAAWLILYFLPNRKVHHYVLVIMVYYGEKCLSKAVDCLSTRDPSKVSRVLRISERSFKPEAARPAKRGRACRKDPTVTKGHTMSEGVEFSRRKLLGGMALTA
jgi:hypothetical protein